MEAVPPPLLVLCWEMKAQRGRVGGGGNSRIRERRGKGRKETSMAGWREGIILFKFLSLLY